MLLCSDHYSGHFCRQSSRHLLVHCILQRTADRSISVGQLGIQQRSHKWKAKTRIIKCCTSKYMTSDKATEYTKYNVQDCKLCYNFIMHKQCNTNAPFCHQNFNYTMYMPGSKYIAIYGHWLVNITALTGHTCHSQQPQSNHCSASYVQETGQIWRIILQPLP